jgi:hypothetical protein
MDDLNCISLCGQLVLNIEHNSAAKTSRILNTTAADEKVFNSCHVRVGDGNCEINVGVLIACWLG